MTAAAMRIEPAMTLARLLAGMTSAQVPSLPVSGLAADSRTVTPGSVFLACRGAARHGLAFAEDAVAAGAVAIVWDGEAAGLALPRLPVPTVAVPGLRQRLGEIANRFFDRPSLALAVAGVTGTNGKTTVAWLLAQCMHRLDRQCAYLGTLGAGLGGRIDVKEGLTTPACVDLHRAMADFRARGAAHLALEVSSHALAQNRLDGVTFDSVLFTNLSRDHIDYHGSMQAYGEIKAGFVLRPDVRRHIINVDSAFGRELAARCDGDVTIVSTVDVQPHAASFVRMQVTATDETGTNVHAVTAWGEACFRLPLAGQFNVANAALVLAQLLSWGMPVAAAAKALSEATPPPGRLQRVAAGSADGVPAVYVDYAHTPAGLEAVLAALRPHCAGQLWCVFGCGGDRDRGKRALMGATAASLADRAVVTDDNPRSEPPGEIIAAILAAMDDTALAIEDRASAIAFAIEHAASEDIVLIAGKGHEEFQLIADRRLPFSDYEVARARLEIRRKTGLREQ